MAADLDVALKFSDKELQEVLGLVDGTGLDEDAAGTLLSEGLHGSLQLQFQPHSATSGIPGSSCTDSYISADSLAAAQADASGAAGLAQMLAGVHCSGSMMPPATLLQPMAAARGNAAFSAAHAAFAAQMGLPGLPALPLSPGKHVLKETRTVSHSTIEKQRRDRINNLIDELRELVPPQRMTRAQQAAQQALLGGKQDSAEARRPKHQVLADTISLLKQLKERLSLEQLTGQMSMDGVAAALAQTPSSNILSSVAPIRVSTGVIKEEPPTTSNSGARGSVSSDDMEKDEGAATATLPQIPVSPSTMAGVSVDKGPEDIMYVQVKCRDRRGLLSDIVNALRLLPLEIRTAAITTNDGMVRNVFEVRADIPTLRCEDVQNMLHDALFQQYVGPPQLVGLPMVGGISAPGSMVCNTPMGAMGGLPTPEQMLMLHRSASPAVLPLTAAQQQQQAAAAMQAAMFMNQSRSCPPELMPALPPGPLLVSKRPRPSGPSATQLPQ